MRTSKLLYICFSIILGLFTCIVPSCQQKSGFDFTAYNSSEELRADLLKQVPIGSTVDDTYKFFKENNIPDAVKLNLSYGYGQFSEEDNTIRLALVMKADIWGARWFINFKFDKEKRLEDIKVKFNRTLP